MKSPRPCVLTLNGGSSSIRFAVYETGGSPRLRLAGKLERVGQPGTKFILTGPGVRPPVSHRIAAADHGAAVDYLLSWLQMQPVFAAIKAVGHRVVHGMHHTEPAWVTPRLLAELRRLTPYDPDHLPAELALITAIRRRHPLLPQVACFDTAFHRTMPKVAKQLPIPRRYAAKGVERYGFHGLSYAFLLEELRRLDPAAANGRVILAHLGSGASLAAVRGGRSVDTTMGFTPAAGLVMATRTGDLDPGLAYFLARTERMSAARFQQMVNHESGLLGVSGTSGDVRDLFARSKRDRRAAEALELFCYAAKKGVGSYAAVLGGVDTIVFSGGIGEHDSRLRARICAGLEFLGLKLDPKRNARNAPVISTRGGRVTVRVIPTNEELMIARSVTLLLGSKSST